MIVSLQENKVLVKALVDMNIIHISTLKGIILLVLLLRVYRFVGNSSGVGFQVNFYRCLSFICFSNYGENMNC